MRRIIGCGVAAVASVALTAQAADMPALVYRAPPPVALWTGCYLGINVGGARAPGSLAETVTGADLGSFSPTGFIGVGQIGCDFQVGMAVIGFQGMADATSIDTNWLQPNGIATTNFHVAWIETVTARFGIAPLPMALLYVKGGSAWVRNDISMAALGVTIASATFTSQGWTVGGVEFMFAPHWSAFLEYGYVGFADQQVTLATPAGLGIPLDFNRSIQTFMVGVNFRFTGLLSPNF